MLDFWYYVIGTKLKNTFYVLADAKTQDGVEYFQYNGIIMLQTFSFEKFLEVLRQGFLKVDFDARTGDKSKQRKGHNHGVKFRIPANLLPTLYETVTPLLDAPLDKQERLKRINIAEAHSTEKVEEATHDGPTIVQFSYPEDKQTRKSQMKVAEQPELDFEF